MYVYNLFVSYLSNDTASRKLLLDLDKNKFNIQEANLDSPINADI